MMTFPFPKVGSVTVPCRVLYYARVPTSQALRSPGAWLPSGAKTWVALWAMPFASMRFGEPRVDDE